MVRDIPPVENIIMGLLLLFANRLGVDPGFAVGSDFRVLGDKKRPDRSVEA